MKRKSGVAILMALVIATAAFAPPAFAASPDNLEEENTFSATDNVDVWKDSILTLRHDFESASTAIETGDYQAGLGSGGQTSLNREFLGVRTAGETIELTYDPGRAQLSGADISETDVQFIAAQVPSGEEPVNTLSGAIDLISQSSNTDAAFEIVENRTLSGGATTFEHTGGAGHYVYFVVDRERGAFSVSPNGTISPPDSGTPTIIGVEQVTYQRGSPRVSAPAVAEPGGNLSFDVDATTQLSSADTVTHTVLVHDQSTFSNVNQGQFKLQLPNKSVIDRDLDLSEDATLSHNINEVNGVASVDDGVQVNGIDISDERVSRAVSIGQVVDFVAEDINGQEDTRSTGDVRFDASVTARAGQSPTQTISVETADDWEPGTYQYVYIGKPANNAGAVVTTTGTISVRENVSVETQGSQTVADDGRASIEFEGDETVSSASFSGLKSGTTASVARLSDAPSSVAVSPASDTEPVYFEINAEAESSDSPPTTNITVDRNRFSDPDDAQAFRYDEDAGEYTQVETVTSVDSNSVTIQFESDFSLFALGEIQRADTGGDGDSDGGGGGGGGSGGISTDFTVTNLTPQTAEVTQGDELTVSATVTTGSYLEDTKDVELRVGGETIASQSVTLQGQESTTVEFTQINTSELEGEYEHGIYTGDESQTGTLTVTPPTETDEPAETDEADTTEETEPADDEQTAEENETETGETEDGTPGFGPLVAVIALLAAALIAARRQR